MDNLEQLVNRLMQCSEELPWLEFKENNYDPDMIGRDISALANGAALHGKSTAYFVWGINDKTHEIVGTEHILQNIKKGNEELEGWLRRQLSKNVDFECDTVVIDGKTVSVMSIQAAIRQPVVFTNIEYIRVGSYTKKLLDYPELQARLWDRLRLHKFESQIAKSDLSLAQALNYLDYNRYFDLLEYKVTTNFDTVGHYLVEEGVLLEQDNGMFAISNLGALLFSKRISDFAGISRKAIRIVKYNGKNRASMQKEQMLDKGYVAGFDELMGYISALLPSEEVITGAVRETKNAYPLLAVREIIANALIHQDLIVSGVGPTIEIFDNRIETTNAGNPLVDVKRIVDNPPKSRNEKLAALMRRLGLCEELGTGWDKIILLCEESQLPAPKITLYEDSTRVTMFEKIKFSDMSQEDRIWACYLHACIRYIQGDHLTNSTLRQRFGLATSSSGSVSRLIRMTMEQGSIKPFDPNTAPRYMEYIPWWA